jgi:hypothetical protein
MKYVVYLVIFALLPTRIPSNHDLISRILTKIRFVFRFRSHVMGQSPSLLLDAVRDKNPSIQNHTNIKALLDQGIDINYIDQEGKVSFISFNSSIDCTPLGCELWFEDRYPKQYRTPRIGHISDPMRSKSSSKRLFGEYTTIQRHFYGKCRHW